MATRTGSKTARLALDARLGSLGPADLYAVPRKGWVRAIRDALGMSAADLGERLGVTHSAVFELERSEQKRTAQLDTLGRAAEAMDCTLVYAFLPRRGLDATVRSRAEEIADADLPRIAHSMALEGQAEPISPDVREDVVERLIASKGLWSRR